MIAAQTAAAVREAIERAIDAAHPAAPPDVRSGLIEAALADAMQQVVA